MAVVAMVSPLGAVSSAQAAAAKQTLSLSAPSSAETRLAFTLSGTGRSARAGRPVVVQRLSGRKWVTVARTVESATGRYSVRTSVTSAGKFTYRAVASSWRGARAVTSPSKVVSVHAPYILLTPATAIRAETAKVTGKLPGIASRPVTVQRRSGTRWVTLAKTKTTRTGSYATSFKAPATGSYSVRTLAPRVRIAGKVRAQYASSAKTLKVVAQTAALSMPATLVQAKTGTATLTFRPIRAGRAVALQVARSGVWTAVATGKQSAAGVASLTVRAGTPASYSYRAWTAAAAGAPAFASPTKTLKVTAPAPVIPGAISGMVTDAGTHAGLANVAVGVFSLSAPDGPSAPASPFTTDGVDARTGADGSYTVTGLTPGTDYQVCFEASGATGGSSDEFGYVTQCYNNLPMVATPTLVTVTTGATRSGIDAALSGGGALSGTVTEAAGTQQRLAGVDVFAMSLSVEGFGFATTGADGSYALKGLPAGSDYQVCFDASGTMGAPGAPGATGGSSDLSGYVAQCYNNQPMLGTPTLVAAIVGATRTGVDAKLASGGAIAGTVTDAAGTHHGLAGVGIFVMSLSSESFGFAMTGADGSYTLKGLPAGSDYQVCFMAVGAKGGSSDTTGYADQCYNNQPDLGMPTPVAVVVGATGTGINAALARAGAITK